MIINVSNLVKSFTTYERGSTFMDTVKSFFKRKTIDIEALKNISFSIDKGELVGFLGPNGAGKSTTLKILSGILYPTSGNVSVLGYTPWKDRIKYVANIGAVFGQKSQLIWDIPPEDSFLMNKAIYGLEDGEYKKTFNSMIELLDVDKIVKRPTRQLSLGERMKCEFIMAMLHKPQIVFLDEPTIGLDVIAKESIREFILEMNKSGVTFILTTHDLDDVERLAKRVIVVNHGEIVFDNSLDALKSHTGAKKIIRLSTHNPLPLLQMEGIEIVKQLSGHDIELELDVSKVELNQFIKIVNESGVINDMSIQALPIESVIKELYLQKK